MRLRTIIIALTACFAFGQFPAWVNVFPAALAQAPETIEQIVITGNQRIEASTVQSYMVVRQGDPFDPARIDQSLKSLFATGLFSDVVIRRDATTLLVTLVENPIINRIAFEGNDRLDNDELLEEVQLRPRIIYTRAKVRADVQRMIELYRRSGRFAASIEPKIIQLPQNRVDLVFEISEGPKTKISRINFIGNERFSDSELRDELATNEARWWKIFGSNDTYDPDRQAFDRELLRQFYLQNGYADFRVISAVAELTPDREDFFVTFTVDEGEIYTFGEIDLVSEIRDINADFFKIFLRMREGQRYNAKLIEDSIEALTNSAGLLGFAFVDIRPQIVPDRQARTLAITFRILDAPRVYVERIDIHGNVRTLDEVIRREFRFVEGDAFNSARINRSEQRLRALGFFREVEIEQIPGNAPDRVIIDVAVQEQATGELSIGAGFSSLESFLLDLNIRERNLLGKGQDLRLGFTLSRLRNQVDIGFTEPYFLGRNIAAGIDLFRTELNNSRFSSFDTTSLGGSLRAGLPLTEFMSLGLRYTLRRDTVRLFFNSNSPFLEDAAGTNTTSAIGYSLIYNSINNPLRPTRGQRAVLSQDLAGLAGNIKYIRSSLDYDYYTPVIGEWVLHLGAEGGHIVGLGQDIRINDRFFLGGPRIRGFDIAGVGPRDTANNTQGGNALGGNVFYVASAELIIPLGAAAEDLGLQPSIFFDVGSVGRPDIATRDADGNPLLDPSGVAIADLIRDRFTPRMAVGIGVTWDSPFGPFRIDLSRIIRKEPFDRVESLQFNVGTTF